MRKKTKIILIVISSIIVLVGVLLFLIFKTNLFLDTSDLICTRISLAGEFEEQEIITLSFDSKSIITHYENKYIVKFNNENEAKEYLSNILLNNGNSSDKFSIEGTSVIFKNVTIIEEENKKYYNKNKKQMKEIYVNEYLYNCE